MERSDTYVKVEIRTKIVLRAVSNTTKIMVDYDVGKFTSMVNPHKENCFSQIYVTLRSGP